MLNILIKRHQNKHYFGGIDPLEDVSCIILDEIHERTILTDLCVAMSKKAAAGKRDFKVILMSATIEIQQFTKYFKD